ncbi:MAG: 3-aminobutyryl-CoA aminotransferase [Alphaproteobacteria bacterium MarineAlpha11_Bin1]|nr:MAG: 3-aminobutyryl-CoA aminotransferase [Alphaproteobacteria bacterium MarineAlpha11_Bin1]|tara:strand:- start:1377 stop:2681 length:1305 start_codon:yes stop_codon:yes gene_type:complete
MTASEKGSNRVTHNLIPGGAHTYSKGDDQFPANAPPYLERGEGYWVWDDRDGRYLDWTMGLRSMSLGYGRPEVNNAAIEQIRRGSNFGRPSKVETDLAQILVDIIPCAEMVKFAKNGSTVTTAAVKLARAHTGREYVAFCKDHPFFSYDDWFIGTTDCAAGVPSAISDLSLPFRYNDLDSLRNLFTRQAGKIACVILEAATTEPPADGFLEGVQALCQENGAVFILDEMITGFRWHLKGAQYFYGIKPDLATFGKGMGNGFSIAALVGKREIMELGGLDHDGERVFLISTTHGAENHALAACIGALRVFETENVCDHMWNIGAMLVDALNGAAISTGMEDHFEAYGIACNPAYVCRGDGGAPSPELRTLFNQEMINRGVLMPYITPCLAHDAEAVSRTAKAAEESLAICANALESGLHHALRGDAIRPVFRKFN